MYFDEERRGLTIGIGRLSPYLYFREASFCLFAFALSAGSERQVR